MNITGSNTTWPTTTRTLTEKTLSNTIDAVFDPRSREHHIESRVEGTVEELIDIIENMLADQEHYCILNSPSKAAMEGAITLTGDTNRSIRPTRPSDELVREFGKAANLHGLEDLWYPPTLIAWSFGIITRYMNRHSDGAIPPDVLLHDILETTELDADRHVVLITRAVKRFGEFESIAKRSRWSKAFLRKPSATTLGPATVRRSWAESNERKRFTTSSISRPFGGRCATRARTAAAAGRREKLIFTIYDYVNL